jgi:LCP family protein required for cell wall assembly
VLGMHVLITARRRLVAGILAGAVVLAAGIFVAVWYTGNRLNDAIPQTDLFGTPTPVAGPATPSTRPSPGGWDIKGPLNILIAGEDTDPNERGREFPHSDAVMILHLDATLTHGYLVSLPRDQLVHVPANPVSGTGADYTKLTHAMTYGSRVPGSNKPNFAQGFALLARTVSAYTGIDHFDAGAIISFAGLVKLVDLLGGIDLYVDHKVTSIHMSPDGRNVYHSGPYMVYNVGPMHLNGWQALDYARQRYSLPNGTYDRERHHRQIIEALLARVLSFDNLLRYPYLAPSLIAALSGMITVDLRGRSVQDYVYALRNLRPENLTLVGLPGHGVYTNGQYRGEDLFPIQADYFKALRADTLDTFLAAHPELVNKDNQPY